MPTYEYECTRCGIVFEEFQSMTAKPRQRCPECRGKVNRLISGGMGIVFKGSGCYQNDSRPKRPAPAAETAGAEASSASAGNDNSNAGQDKG